MKTLGELCDIIQGTPLSKDITHGKYDVDVGGKTIGTYTEYNQEGDSFTINRQGEIYLQYHSIPYYLTDGYSIRSKSKTVKTEYIYYLLLHNTEGIKNILEGRTDILKTDLEGMEIPVPSLSQQKLLIDYYDFIYKVIKTNRKKINELKELIRYEFDFQEQFGKNIFGGNTTKKLRKLGIMITKGTCLQGSCILVPEHSIEECLWVEEITPTDMFVLTMEDKSLLKYIYYSLKYYTEYEEPITIELLEHTPVDLPTNERQMDMIRKCDYNERMIEELEDDIKYRVSTLVL